MADMPAINASLAGHAADAGRVTPPRVLALADVLVRDEPGEARRLMDDLLGSMEGEAGRKWSEQMARLRSNPDTPSIFPYFAGTADEVADQILEAHTKYAVDGILFRTPLWAAEEMLRLKPVFERLAKAGVWSPPAARSHSW